MKWYTTSYSVMGEIAPGKYMEFVSDEEYYEYMEEKDED